MLPIGAFGVDLGVIVVEFCLIFVFNLV